MKLLPVGRIRLLFLPFFLMFTVTVAGCNSADSKDIIAQVDNFGITITEFQDRFNFNPYLRSIDDVNIAKKVVLSSLIAEKILSLEVEERSRLSENVNLLIRQHLREAMIEQFRRDSVESLIKISDTELQYEYQKAIRELDVQYIAFDSLEAAIKVKAKINSGHTFDAAVREYMDSKGWDAVPIPSKKIQWANEDYDLEEKIYELKKNEVSNIIKTHGDYYLIRIENIELINNPSSLDYNKRLPALEDRILRKKIKQLYRTLYTRTIQKAMGIADWDKMSAAAELVADEIEFSKADHSQIIPKEYKPLPENVYLSRQVILQDLKNNIAVKFPDESSWTFQELMVQLKYGPYAFDFSDKRSFINSFIDNIRLLMEHEAIYRIAKRNGYEQNKLVQTEYRVWKSFYQANAFRHDLLEGLDKDLAVDEIQVAGESIEEKRLKYFDEKLASYSDDYRIYINKAVYDTVSLHKMDMVVRKSHFANRLVSPRLEPLTGLPLWQKKMDSLFGRYGIN